MTSYGNSAWYLEGRDNYHQGVSFQNVQNDMILTPSVTKVILICSAHYPVYWTYDLPDGDGSRTIPPSAYLHRTSEDFKDPKTYKFYSYITLSTYSGLNTGTFTCRSAKDEGKQTSRFIYYQGATQSLVYGEGRSETNYDSSSSRCEPFSGYDSYSACKTPSCLGLPSKTVQADKNNQTITLPCAINSPNTRVKLYKKSESTIKDYKEIELTGVNATTAGIAFDPKVGFIINVTEQVTPPYGIYKCAPEPQNSFATTAGILIINVTTGVESETKKESDNLSGNAKYSFDTSAHDKFGDRIDCCSSGTKPPQIYKTYCSTKYECTTARQQLQEFKNPDKSDIRSGHCRSFVAGPAYRSPSLPVIGVFRCVGEGIDVTREFYVPPTTSYANESAIYYDNEISGLNKSDLIKISGVAGTGYAGYGSGSVRLSMGWSVMDNQLIGYSDQSITLSCHPSKYLFALGIRWSIVYQNRTTQIMPEKRAYVIDDTIATEFSNELKVKTSTDIHSVNCHAPLYDSSAWVNQTLYFNITHPEAPEIVGPTHETLTWRVGDTDKELNCEATGVPTPTVFTWIEPVKYESKYDYFIGAYKPSPTWSAYNLNRVTVRGEGKSSLKFKQVLSTMGGDYTCTAAGSSRLGQGSVIKSFTVKVTGPLIESTTTGTITTTTTTTTEKPQFNNNTKERDASTPPLTKNDDGAVEEESYDDEEYDWSE